MRSSGGGGNKDSIIPMTSAFKQESLRSPRSDYDGPYEATPSCEVVPTQRDTPLQSIFGDQSFKDKMHSERR